MPPDAVGRIGLEQEVAEVCGRSESSGRGSMDRRRPRLSVTSRVKVLAGQLEDALVAAALAATCAVGAFSCQATPTPGGAASDVVCSAFGAENCGAPSDTRQGRRLDSVLDSSPAEHMPSQEDASELLPRDIADTTGAEAEAGGPADIIDAKAEADGDSNPEDMEADADVVDLCVPDCAGKKCGTDGCGGNCGTCEGIQECESGACVDSDHRWSRSFGTIHPETASAVAADAEGSIYLAGSFAGDGLDLGDGPLPHVEHSDVFLAKFSSDGELLWAHGHGGEGNEAIEDLATVGASGFVVTGPFDLQGLDLGGGPLQTNGGKDIFVARFDADGGHVWSAAYGGSAEEKVRGIAVDPEGGVFLAGSFSSQNIDFGGGALVNADPMSGHEDVFLVKFDQDGNHLWSQSFGGPDADLTGDVAVGHDGRAYLTGAFESPALSLGGEPLANPPSPYPNTFLAAFGSDGAPLWSKAFLGAGESPASWGMRLGTDSNSDVVLAGTFTAEGINLGAGPHWNALPSYSDVFLARFDKDGQCLWSKAFGTSEIDAVEALHVDESGNSYLGGLFVPGEPVSLGGGLLPAGGDFTGYVVKRKANGDHVWSSVFGVGLCFVDEMPAVWAGNGEVVLAGSFCSPVLDMGGGPLVNAGGRDIFIAKLQH
jgi:hypothetical protein